MAHLQLVILILFGVCSKNIDSQSTNSSDSRICCFKDRVVTSCFNACSENTCENLNNPKICTRECQASNVCVCRENLYRNECNECVTAEGCSKTCQKPQKLTCPGQNERLYGCFDPTQARVCPSTRCSKPRDFLLKYSRSSPQQGLCALNMCECIEGFLRNKCGQCVPPSECGKKSCIGKCSPCSGLNEVRIKKFRKCHERSCKNLFWPKKCKGKAGRVRKNVCDCMIGYRRNNCGKCVPEDQCNENVPCLCTNPCVEEFNAWQCFNDCNRPSCKNYYELPNKTCPSECTYVCACDVNLGLWFNGTACVPGDQCPPYEIASAFPYVSLSELTQPQAPTTLVPPPDTPQTTETTTTTTTQAPTTTLAPTQSPNNPIISITLSIGKK